MTDPKAVVRTIVERDVTQYVAVHFPKVAARDMIAAVMQRPEIATAMSVSSLYGIYKDEHKRLCSDAVMVL